MSASSTAFALTGPLPAGRTLIEASAGTGKTYTIAALVARFVAGELSGQHHDLTEGVAIDEILVVTYTRAAASELRDRIRIKLQLAADHLEGDPHRQPPPGEAWLAAVSDGSARVRLRRVTRLRTALARFDEATITTIHGFCQQALAQGGLRAGTPTARRLIDNDRRLIAEVVRDLLLDRLLDEPLALSIDRQGRPLDHRSFGAEARFARRPIAPDDVERYLVDTVAAVLTNLGAGCLPATDSGGVAGAWAACVTQAVAEVERRQRARHEISYDRLISDLDAALADPVDGPLLAAQLSARHRLVLIDEFQDTDRVQWRIFDRAFAGHRLVTVGDPKQAIFRFRGADVHAYLAAVRTAERATLRTNHRSDRQLLDALAVLFDGATLGHADIEFMRVDASPTAPRRAIGEVAVHLRVVPDDPAVAHTAQGMEAAAAASVVLADVAARTRSLLDTAVIRIGRSSSRVRKSDIGILVPSQRRAAETARVLGEWGIPTVRARTGSVLHSEAALQWRLLLAGVAAPTDARVAKAAGMSWFFDLAPSRLVEAPGAVPADGAGETSLAALQRQLASHAAVLRGDGFAALYERLRVSPALLDAVFARPTGDRDLTDLDHLAELLIDDAAGGSTEPARVAEAFDRLTADADDLAEASMRRVETDADAVQITTVHSAKGLEYPIVLLPFAYTERPQANRPYVFDLGGTRVVDVASWVAWGTDVAEGSREAEAEMADRKHRARAELDGDAIRLLYVAMTRAKHHLEVWWAPTRGAATSALGRLLLDRWGAGPVFNSALGAAYEKADVARTDAQIDAIVEAANGTIARVDVPLIQPVRRPLPLLTRPARLLTVADDRGRHPLADPARRTWSFTTIAARLEHSGVDGQPATPGVAAVGGGLDEVVAEEDVNDEVVDGEATAEEVVDGEPAVIAATGAITMPLADVGGGTTFGITVHEVLERVDFTSPTLDAEIADHVASAARRSGIEVDVGAVATGLLAAVDTPLGDLFGGRRLADVAPADRLAELAFDLTLGPPTIPALGPPTIPALGPPAGGNEAIGAAVIGATLTATLADDDPLRPYFAGLIDDLGPVQLAGWLTGSIDALVRVGDGDDRRYVVIDYKSNRLHSGQAAKRHGHTVDPLAAYHPDLLVAAMTHSHYPLQAVLYLVAVHRYLTWRLGRRYHPDRHLGGAAYLFVRGMVGPTTPTAGDAPYGVFTWTPSATSIAALDAALGAPSPPPAQTMSRGGRR